MDKGTMLMKKTIAPTTLTTSSRVYSKFSCKYYVYGLFKPNGVLFYVGKGKGSRINDHFKPSNLKVKSPKASIIKKYGDSIIREIFEYFDYVLSGLVKVNQHYTQDLKTMAKHKLKKR